jgi:hypothetical protein
MFTRKHSLYIIIPALLLAAFSSCKKSELTAFDQPAMVQFYKHFDDSKRDSFLYSFAIKPADLMVDTVKLPVRISGVAANKDRQINLKTVADSTNAVAGTDYIIHSSIVRAGRYNDSIWVIVKRTPDMGTTEKRLMLEIVPSEDFQPGIGNMPVMDGSFRSGAATRMLVKINDFLTKPSDWDKGLHFFFGTYSRVKFQFIIQVTGRTEFPYGTAEIPYGQFSAYKNMMVAALSDYVKEHGPMIDENGQVVSF